MRYKTTIIAIIIVIFTYIIQKMTFIIADLIPSISLFSKYKGYVALASVLLPISLFFPEIGLAFLLFFHKSLINTPLGIRFAFIGLLLLILITLGLRNRFHINKKDIPLIIFMLFFMLWVTLSFLNGQKTQSNSIVFAEFFITMCCCLSLLFFYNQKDDFAKLIKAMAILGIIFILQWLIQMKSGMYMVDERIGLGTTNQNYSAQIFSCIFFTLLYYFRTVKIKTGKIIIILLEGVTLYGMFLTGSRQGIVFIACVLLVEYLYFLLVRRSKYAARGLIIFVLLAVFLIEGYAPLKESRIFTASQNVGEDSRIEIWVSYIELAKEHPLTGVGFKQYANYNVANTSGAHNLWIELITSYGLMGWIFALILLLLIIKTFLNLQSLYKHNTREDNYMTTFFEQLFAYFILISITGMDESTIHTLLAPIIVIHIMARTVHQWQFSGALEK